MAQKNVADSEDISSDKIILFLYKALEIQPFQIRCGETIEKALEKKTDEEIRQMLFDLTGMAIRVVEFSNGGYKIRNIFA